MPQALVYTDITCPYCYSSNATQIDISGGDQDYYEDCQVCCAPMAVGVHIDDEGEVATVDVSPGNG